MPHEVKRPDSLLAVGVVVSQSQLSPSSSRKALPATLLWQNHSLPVPALIDSGADDNFIDQQLVRESRIPTVCLEKARVATALDGRFLARITQKTVPLTLIVSGNHRETIELLIVISPQSPLVLGKPWLDQHNPRVDWSSGEIVGFPAVGKDATRGCCDPISAY